MNRSRSLFAGALIALAIAASGCSTKYEVESDTTWKGWVEDHSVAGVGRTVFEARQGGAATFTKTTDRGFLRARVKGFWGDDRWVETTAPYGSVIVVASEADDD